MPYCVELTDDALIDIEAIASFYIDAGNAAYAAEVVTEIDDAVASLFQQPRRGHTPHELYSMGRTDELEIIVGIFRIIYLIRGYKVIIIAVFDGRQNVKKHLLERRARSANV